MSRDIVSLLLFASHKRHRNRSISRSLRSQRRSDEVLAGFDASAAETWPRPALLCQARQCRSEVGDEWDLGFYNL